MVPALARYFYGNGVFRSTFVGIIAGKNASVLENWLYSWINTGVQLVGYYAAALTVDVKWIGRRRMTVFSFFMVSVLVSKPHHEVHEVAF